jgi:hypothetical protein
MINKTTTPTNISSSRDIPRTRPSARWYVGPAIAAGLLALTVPFTA